MIEMTQLVQFCKVAEKGNMTHAARELHLSQPALSRAIGKLEEELGMPLFERKTRMLELTDAGRLLQSRARQILSLLDDLRTEIVDDGQSGQLRIGAIPTIAPYFLPELLRSFGKEFPLAKISIFEQTTDNLIKSVQQGEVDLAVVALPISAKYVELEKLFSEELLLVCAPEHELNRQTQITLKQLSGYPFVLMDEAHCLSENIVSACQRKAFHPISVERTTQLAMVQELVALDHGISMIPAMACLVDPSAMRCYRRITQPKPRREIAMLINPYRFESRLQGEFKKRLRQCAQKFGRTLEEKLAARFT